MDPRDPEERKDKKRIRKHVPKLTKEKLDRFLSSICEAAGMTGKPPREDGARAKGAPKDVRGRLSCRGACASAEWRPHLALPAGILCVSASWSTNKRAEKHRDVNVAITYKDEGGKVNYTDMVFCDSEVRWLMETLWHAPIWE